jgi:hypothetical protein
MQATEPTNQRPKRLTILLVLTLINTGSSIFFGLLTVLFFKPTAADLKKERLEMAKSIVELKDLGLDSLVEMLEKVQSMTEVLNAHFISSNLVNIAIAMIGAAAAYLMFKRNHLGFHGYIIYNLLACVSVYFFVSPAMVPSIILIVNLIISLIFVLLYAKHLTWMKGDRFEEMH